MASRLRPIASAEMPTIEPPARMATTPGNRAAHSDIRWAAICEALTAIRERRRHAVRIVDADCACGTLLIEAARHARSLGFTAIEAHGVDGSPALIGRARASAARVRDPAVGFAFEVADMIEALTREADFPADIVLWHGSRIGDDREGVAAALAAAGDLVIGELTTPPGRAQPA